MDEMELKNLGEAARVTEKLADFAGNVVLQLMRKQGYVEKKGVQAILTYVEKGKGTLTAAVPEGKAEEFKERLKKRHVPYVEIAYTNPETKEKSMFFVYRDSDREKMAQIIKSFALEVDQSCHEVDLASFEEMMQGKEFGSVSGLTREEVYIFREAAKDHNIHFCVVADGSRYGIVANDAVALEDALADMCFNMAGPRGKEYREKVAECLRQREAFSQKAKPGKGTVKYVVDARNPENFISIDEWGFTTHSIRSREEIGLDGKREIVYYDARHKIHFEPGKEWLQEAACRLACPVIVDEMPLVEGFTSTGEAVLVPDFAEQYGKFAERMEALRKSAGPDIRRIPSWEPLYSRERLEGYRGLPVGLVTKLQKIHIPGLYINGGDIAYPKESEKEVEAWMAEYFYRDMAAEQREEARERHRGTDRNEAVDFMLSIEPLKRKGLYARYRTPVEFMAGVQREAMENMENREVVRQTFDREAARQLRERLTDRRIAQDLEK